MKKFISMILVLFLLSSNIVVTMASDSQYELLDEAFADGIVTYEIPEGSTMASLKAGQNGFSDYGGDISVSGDALLFKSTSTNAVGKNQPYTILFSSVSFSGKVAFEITVNIDKTQKDTANWIVSNIFKLKDSVTSGWTDWLQIARNGRIYCGAPYTNNDNAIYQISEGVDTKIKAIADLNGDTVDLYINDNLVKSNISIVLPDSVSEWRLEEKLRDGAIPEGNTVENYYSHISIRPTVPLITTTTFEGVDGDELVSSDGFPEEIKDVPADAKKIVVKFSEKMDLALLTNEYIRLEKRDKNTNTITELSKVLTYTDDNKLEIVPQEFVAATDYILTFTKDIASINGVSISHIDKMDKVLTYNVDMPVCLKAVNEAQSDEALISEIETYKFDFGIDTNNYNDLMSSDDKLLFAQRLFTEKQAGNFASISEVRRLYLIHELLIMSKGNFSLALTEENSKFLGIDASVVNNMNDDAKAYAMQKLNSEAFDSVISLKDKYDEICAVSIVSKALNYSEIKSALFDTYKHQITLDTTYYDKLDKPNDVFKAMLKSDYNSIDEIETGFKLESKKCLDAQEDADTKKSSGRGGNSGRGSSSLILTDTVKPTLPETPPEPIVVPDSDNSETKFSDLGSVLWAEDAINALKQKNIVMFPSDGLFRPMDKITRAEFVALVIRALDMSTVQSTGRFADVQDTHWCSGYIEAAFNKGIINGTSESTFSPDAPITREDIAVILHRSCVHFGINNAQSSQMNFSDAENISQYATEAVAVLSGLGVINGTSEGNFEGKRSATRAEAAKMIYEIIMML